MAISHEYINSFGVLVAIVLSISGSLSTEDSVVMVGSGEGPAEPDEPILIRDENEIWLRNAREGYIQVLNSTDRRIYIWIEPFVAEDCSDSSTIFRNHPSFGYAAAVEFDAYASVPAGFDSWNRTTVNPEEIIEVPWRVDVFNKPEMDGKICIGIRTLTSDGNSYFLPYRVGFFSNFLYDDPDREEYYDIREIRAFENGVATTISEDERDRLLTAGSDQFHGSMGQVTGTRFLLVPETTCFTILGFKNCWESDQVVGP